MEDVPPQLKLSLAAVVLSCGVVVIMLIMLIMLIIIIVIFRLRMITDHVVHGKKQTEDPGKHPWRQELLPEGQRRLQPGDEHEDEESGDKKIKMAKMTMVKVAIVRPKDKVEDNNIEDEDDNDSDKNLKYQLHDDCQTVLT